MKISSIQNLLEESGKKFAPSMNLKDSILSTLFLSGITSKIIERGFSINSNLSLGAIT